MTDDVSLAAAHRLAALADQVDDAAQRLAAGGCGNWSSLAADRYRERLGELAAQVRAVAASVREASGLATELHRQTEAAQGSPISWVVGVRPWR